MSHVENILPFGKFDKRYAERKNLKNQYIKALNMRSEMNVFENVRRSQRRPLPRKMFF